MERKNDPILEMFAQKLRREWDRCAADVLHAISEEEGKFNKYGDPMATIDRDNVFDIRADQYFGGVEYNSDEYIY